jgi:hypothetical protein
VGRDRRAGGAGALVISTIVLALVGAPSAARAEPAATAHTPAGDARPGAKETTSAPPSQPAPPNAVAIPSTSAPAMPVDAEGALSRARAAYEYGEMEMVVDSARLVAEGRLHPTPAERAQALRYLGIGLYLTERQEGAETAFFDLLRLRPRTRLEATTTRPDVVAFFENVRRRHAAEINEAASNRPGKSLALAFLPPFGQFQSGHKARGITIAALEVLSLGTAIATDLQLHAWDKYPGHTFAPPPGQPEVNHVDGARILKPLNWVSISVLVATVIVGIVDGVASYTAVEPEDTGTSVADVLGRGFRF